MCVCVQAVETSDCLSKQWAAEGGGRHTRAQARNIVWEKERAAWQVNNQSCSAGRHGNEAWQHRQRRRHAHKERHTHTHTHIKRRAGIRFKVQIHTHTHWSAINHTKTLNTLLHPSCCWPLTFNFHTLPSFLRTQIFTHKLMKTVFVCGCVYVCVNYSGLNLPNTNWHSDTHTHTQTHTHTHSAAQWYEVFVCVCVCVLWCYHSAPCWHLYWSLLEDKLKYIKWMETLTFNKMYKKQI